MPKLYRIFFSSKWMNMKDIEKAAKNLIIFFIIIYKAIFSLWMGGCCRYTPSCSDYALRAFKVDTFFRAFFLSLIRIIKCRPFGDFGYDPYPHQVDCSNKETE